MKLRLLFSFSPIFSTEWLRDIQVNNFFIFSSIRKIEQDNKIELSQESFLSGIFYCYVCYMIISDMQTVLHNPTITVTIGLDRVQQASECVIQSHPTYTNLLQLCEGVLPTLSQRDPLSTIKILIACNSESSNQKLPTLSGCLSVFLLKVIGLNYKMVNIEVLSFFQFLWYPAAKLWLVCIQYSVV